jgi:AraC-like DNA-binding protein
MRDDSTAGLRRLERSCDSDGIGRDWFQVAPDTDGLLRVEADLDLFRYAPHRHDTYAIGLTLAGVQSFHYRHERRDCLPGHVIVLHPDELHDGKAGTDQGFRYRMIYLDPNEIQAALTGRANTLPFLRDGHCKDRRLHQAVLNAISDLKHPVTSLERAGIVQSIADALLGLDPRAARSTSTVAHKRSSAVMRARDLLDTGESVPALELERATGLDRFDLARHFRRTFGTSPYRYHQMRRLDRARRSLAAGMSLSEAALAYGFADQSHFTRQFKAAYGLPPGRWQRMIRPSF